MAEQIEPAVADATTEESGDKPKKRAFITLHDKIDICIESEMRLAMEENLSLKRYCLQKSEAIGIDIQALQVRGWKKNLVNMKKTVDNTTKKKHNWFAPQGGSLG